MAEFECRYYSRVLARNVVFYAMLPDGGGSGEEAPRCPEGRFPTAFLLHGGLEDCFAWPQKTSLVRYAQRYGLAAVAVSYENSYLTDLRTGSDYWTWINDDLIPYVRSVFPLSARRADTFVAGASMGGYCAAKLALRRPDTFGGLAILSGAVDSGDELKGTPDPMNYRNPFFIDAFGSREQYLGSENDVVALLRSFEGRAEELPKIYHCCGTKDKLYRDNTLYRDLALAIGADITWEEAEEGHTWEFWDICIQHAMEFFSAIH